MSRKCRICKQSFYYQTESEAAEPCWCGECAEGPLWRFYGGGLPYLKAMIKLVRYRVAWVIYALAERIEGADR